MKRLLLNIIKLTVLLVVCTCAVQFNNTVFGADKEQTIEDGTYIIKSAINEKFVFDIYNNSKTDGANLELWTNNKTTNQKFIVKYLGDGTYSITASHSKKSIDVEGNSKKSGANVLQWTSNNQDNQKWIIKSAGNGYYKIISKSNNLCLDIPYSDAKNGANVQVWVDNGGKNQMFKFEKQTTTTTTTTTTGTKTIEDGTYMVKSAINQNYVFDIYNNSKADGANLELWTNNQSTNQKFTVKYLNDGTYSITAVHSKKSIDVEGNLKKSGTNVLQWTSNNQDNQKWIIKDAGSGYYNIISKSSGLYLDIPESKAKNGANVQIWVGNGGKNQMFKFEKITETTTTTTTTTTTVTGSKTINNGIYTIKSLIDSKAVLDLADQSMNDGGNLLVWSNNNTINQKFTINYLNDGSYTISPIHSGKYIDVEGASKKSGTNVLQWSYNGDNNQRWIIKSISNGEYNIISKDSGLYLTVESGNVCVKKADNSNKQKFKFDNSNTVPSIDTSKYPGYKEKVQQLIKNHPNWHFEFLYTGLKFDDVVKGEYKLDGRNLVPSSYSGEWICSKCGTKLYDSGWYCASEKATAYYMDPRNFLDEVNVFQFYNVNEYIADTSSLEAITSQVKGTFLQNYASDIYNACRNKKVNAFYIISRLIQEQGKNGTTIGKGMKASDGKTYYNPFNIGASGNGSSEIYANALAKAQSYGWNTMQKAIEGGIDFCKVNWLDNYQNTLYQNKFDIDTRNGTSLYTHQYMQNLLGAYSEANLLQGMYKDTNKLNSYMTFIIPVYENMSTTLSPLPQSGVETYPINVQITTTKVQVRDDASDSGKVIKTINSKDTVILSITRRINGNWHRVVLTDGTIGYINGSSLEQIADVKNCNYTAKVKTNDGSGCKVRIGPGIKDETTVLTAIADGTKVTVIDDGRYNNIDGYNWCRIILSDGRQAFMPNKFLVKN